MKVKSLSIILLILCTLLVGQPLVAQPKKHKKSPNVSLLNIGKTVKDSLKVSYANLGLLSNIYKLKGAGINVISSVVKTNAYGAQISGFVNIAGGTAGGVQLAGISNISGYDMSGLTGSGLVNLVGHNANGLMLTGGINITGKDIKGVATGGLINISGGDIKGVAFSGLANVSAGDQRGLAVSGLVNVDAHDLKGAQLSTLLNVSGNDIQGVQIAALGNVGINLKGAQISGLSNIVATEMTGLQACAAVNIAMKMNKGLQIAPLANICLQGMGGAQVGIGNYATEVKGTQIGLLNICGGEVKGVQIGLINHSKDTSTVKIGLVNINPRTRIQMLAYGGNAAKFNVAVRFLNRHTYTLLGVGTPYLRLNDKFSGAIFYRAGIHRELIKNLRLSGDLGYYHIENFENKNADTPERMYSLQARVNVEYNFTKKFGIFASGGYGMTRFYNQNKMYENKPIFELGVVLF